MSVIKEESSDPVVYGAADLRRVLGIGRPNAYRLLRQLGRRVGRRLVIARVVLERWLADGETDQRRARGSQRRSARRGTR